MAARSEVKIGLCLLSRKGYEFMLVRRSYTRVSSVQIEQGWSPLTYILFGSMASAVHFATRMASENGST